MFTFQTSSFHLQQPNRRESAWFTLAISHRIIGNRKILIRRKISSHSIGTEIRTTRVSKISKYRNLSGKFVPEIDVLAAPTNTTGNLDRGKNGRVSRDRMSPLHAQQAKHLDISSASFSSYHSRWQLLPLLLLLVRLNPTLPGLEARCLTSREVSSWSGPFAGLGKFLCSRSRMRKSSLFLFLQERVLSRAKSSNTSCK